MSVIVCANSALNTLMVLVRSGVGEEGVVVLSMGAAAEADADFDVSPQFSADRLRNGKRRC